MRKIAFRAWDTYKNEFVTVKSLTWISDKFVLVNNLGEDRIRGIPRCILMQYTGLTDKNGKEIYEGDIVGKYIDKNNLNIDGKPSRWIKTITWNNENHGWDILDKELHSLEETYEEQWDEDCLLDNPENLEVIGNIYENPNLLNQ